MRPSRLVLATLAVLLAAGCPRPLRFGPEGELTDPAYLLRRLDASSARTRSLKAEARVSVKSASQSGTVSEFIAALRPASLHLETLNFFGKPVAALATDGTRFGLYVEESATFYSGPATAANVGRLLPVALEPAEAVALLLGDVPRLAEAEVRLELDREARAYRLTLTRSGVVQRLWVGTEDLRLLRTELRGMPGLDVSFEDFQAFEGVVFPMSIRVKAVRADGSAAGTEVELRYKEPEHNVALDPGLFVLEPPPGARIVLLDEAGNELP
ncbi:MAG: DUF4292 domain-containing protein [Deltaproteobacteria bacterium]|nr:DUF4292 domain-containing protein [Deltaproteobacteria bacterium]